MNLSMIGPFLKSFIPIAAGVAAIFGVSVSPETQEQIVGLSVRGYEAVLVLIAVADSAWNIVKTLRAKP